MALSEYARAIKQSSKTESLELFGEACKVFEAILTWSKDLTQVGQIAYEGNPPSHSLAIPMITLNVICELRSYDSDSSLYEDIVPQCLKEVGLHVNTDAQLVPEVVSPEGELIDTPEGRVLNCGHAIEAGWFVLEFVRRFSPKNSSELTTMALNMIEWSYEIGWDDECGGIYYFLDREGHSPEQLEWPMKLWWVHNETMVAMLLAYKMTKEQKWWDRYEKVSNYTMTHFPDTRENNIVVPEPPGKGGRKASPKQQQEPGGAWFGYLDRQGRVSQRFKGGPYKGFFHVPRCLLLCSKWLQELAEESA
eukprot:m.100914 g.100914  ORF g.100914 m.100914 type:complete len:306 (+) comp22259_c0_seq2:139-1056(+)